MSRASRIPDFATKDILTRRQATRCAKFSPQQGEVPQEAVHLQNGPNFGRVTSADAYQLPRTYRLSVGLRF